MLIFQNAKVQLFSPHRHLQALQIDFPCSFPEKDFVLHSER
jgi:hypothetical protein